MKMIKSRFIFLFFISCFLIIGNHVFCQVGSMHHIISPRDLIDYSLVGEKTGLTYCIPNKLKVFITVSSSSGKIYVDPWQVKSMGSCSISDSGSVLLGPDSPRQRLELKHKSVKFCNSISSIKLPFKAWVYGFSAMPFRLRLKQNIDGAVVARASSASTVNFALALFGGRVIKGWSSITPRAMNNNAFSVVGFLGPSYVDVSREVGAPVSLEVKNRINPTVVYGTGLTFSRNALGLTLYFGWENAFGANSSYWIYNGNMFMGIGFSASFMR